MSIEILDGNEVNFDLTNYKKTFLINGVQNSVKVGNLSKLNAKIEIKGNNNSLIIGEKCNIRGHILINGNNSKVIIGDYSRSVGIYIMCGEGKNVSIGKHCLFSRDVELRTTDAHAVVDLKNLERINIAQDVYLGDHVWCGVGVMISKGVYIADDNIIGAYSFVNKSISESHCIIAGQPAHIVKRDVTWSRNISYTKKTLFEWKV